MGASKQPKRAARAQRSARSLERRVRPLVVGVGMANAYVGHKALRMVIKGSDTHGWAYLYDPKTRKRVWDCNATFAAHWFVDWAGSVEKGPNDPKLSDHGAVRFSAVSGHLRFVLFAGDMYSPGIGWDYFNGMFGTVDEAKAAIPKRHDWQIVDLETMVVVESGANGI